MSSRRGIAVKSKRPPRGKTGARQRLKPADRQSMIVAGAVGYTEHELLVKVCDLYALSTLEAVRGWPQEHGRLTASRSKSL